MLYIGVTSTLYVRISEHKSGTGSQVTSKYKCFDQLYYEFFADIESAIHREKRLKKWNRAWKEELIRLFNPDLRDLYLEIEDLV